LKTWRDARMAMAGGAAALIALACAPGAVFAQAAVNPTDVLAPAEHDETSTFTFRTQPGSDLGAWSFNPSPSPSLELSAGEKWRFTLDLDSSLQSFDFEGVRAGAFFNITPRMSLGGALSISDENDAITRAGAFDGEVPEVKFESAFRF
jgi:hypothetical protein